MNAFIAKYVGGQVSELVEKHKKPLIWTGVAAGVGLAAWGIVKAVKSSKKPKNFRTNG